MNEMSTKELEVLTLLSQGYSYIAIADRLLIKADTVKKHSKKIYEKLGVRNRTEAINLYTKMKKDQS
jgi:DNA-binding NarL/FixJ family response regulator